MTRDRIERELRGMHEDAYGWCVSCCGHDAELAQDALQDSYVRILGGAAARFRGDASFRSWVFGVIRHVALEHLRRRRSRQEAVDALASDPPEPARRSEPGGDMEREERAALLRAALRRLPDRQREVIHLVFYEGLTVEGAAGVMGVGVGTARTHYHRAKKRLESELSQVGVS